jgi:hypothetical protein
MMRKLLFMAGALLLAHAADAAQAGKVIFVAGSAKIDAKVAVLDGAVNEGELLATGADGYIYIKTVDDGLFIIRPNSQARIASYHIDAANPANTRIKLELLSGVARSQSGQAVKLARQNFRFNTPVAAIGVRGTDFTVFTDQNTSRVTVLSGGITMSGFLGGCRPEGSGPCEGNTARELSAAQKGLLLQVQRGQNAAPQLLQGNNALSPDVVAPPRSDEPGKAASSTTGAATTLEPSLDAKKNLSLQAAATQIALNQNAEKPADPPAIKDPTPPETPIVVAPPVTPVTPKEVSWGRFTAIAEQAPTSGLSKDGAERIGVTDDFVLFRSRSGASFVTPSEGGVAFAMQSSEAYMRNLDGTNKAPVSLSNGQLSFDFGKASFATSFDVKTVAAESFTMVSSGKLTADGVFSSRDQGLSNANMGVTGVISSLNGATYIFQGTPDSKRVVNGVTVWAK